MGEEIWAFNKLDGQNFCARYNPKKKEFIAFGSKKMIVDETHEQFGAAVVCKPSTLLKDQKLPMVKIKTNWWLNELKTLYPNNWEELE